MFVYFLQPTIDPGAPAYVTNHFAPPLDALVCSCMLHAAAKRSGSTSVRRNVS